MGLQLWWGTGLEERSRDRSINSGGHKESVIGLIVFKAAICPKLIMMSCSAESSALTASLKPQNDSERQGAITLTLPSHTAVSGRQSGDNHGPSWSGASGGTSRGVSTVEGPAFLQWGQWPPDINLFMTKAHQECHLETKVVWPASGKFGSDQGYWLCDLKQVIDPSESVSFLIRQEKEHFINFKGVHVHKHMCVNA